LLPQSLPHEPQWSTLVVTSVQMPLQQRCPAPHVAPQTPQFISVFVVAQTPPQQLCPAAQDVPAPHRHSPMSHTSPAAQGAGHGMSLVQIPPTHICPAGHIAPQLPQFISSASVSMHDSPQHPRPSPQVEPPPH
jgi:hypothetical protein